MAYTDIIHQEYNKVTKTGGTLQFAFDTPIAQDGSPHIEQLIIQLDMTLGDATDINSNFSNVFSAMRVKTGSDELINFTAPILPGAAPTTTANLKSAPLGYAVSKLGGCDDVVIVSGTNAIGNLAIPLGLSASVSHRMNFSITFGSIDTWSASEMSASTLSILAVYGTSTEAVIYGSGQQFDDTAAGTRTAVIYGKSGWNMLGVLQVNDQAADELTEVRVRNGSFRALKPSTWRLLNGDWTNGIQYFNKSLTYAPELATNNLAGQIFIDLRRLSAGAGVELDVTSTTTTTRTYFPIWVAAIGAATGNPPRQTASTKQNVTENVLSDTY